MCGEFVLVIVCECLDDVFLYFCGIFDCVCGKFVIGAAFRARSSTSARRRFFFGGFVLCFGNWCVGFWD